jgi:hypothetical protein
VNSTGFLLATFYFAAAVSINRFHIEPVHVTPSSPLDATVPEPPDPVGDCGAYDDSEECET